MVKPIAAIPNLVSVVIPTRSRPEAVADAVWSVFAGTYQRFEVLVVDQSADQATRSALASWQMDSRFHYHRNLRADRGAASSRNIGIALSSGEFVAIIDDDVMVRSDWLASLVAEFRGDPELQFICGKLTAPPHDQRTGFFPSFDPDQVMPALTDWTMPLEAAGANFSMRRTLFELLGGYDECFGPGKDWGSDDGDLAFRIVRRGIKWKACSSVEVVHTNGFRNASQTAVLLKRYMQGNGAIYGRCSRRGDIIAGLWYLRRQFRGLVSEILRDIPRGRKPRHLGWVRDGLLGFWRGFLLPIDQGVVSAAGLRRIRAQYMTDTELGAGEQGTVSPP